jgi:hypothetical protein
MAMPGAIETSKHYDTMASFRKDEQKMNANGWSTQTIQRLRVPAGLLRRLLRRRAPDKVDVRYLRENWPDEA